MRKIKYVVLGALLLLVLNLDKQYYPRVEYEYVGDRVQVTCKDESTMFTHMSSFLIGTTQRDKEAYEIYCVGKEE
jgi:hypothetical protein